MVRRRRGSKNENHVELGACEEPGLPEEYMQWDYSPSTGLLQHRHSATIGQPLCLKVNTPKQTNEHPSGHPNTPQAVAEAVQ